MTMPRIRFTRIVGHFVILATCAAQAFAAAKSEPGPTVTMREQILRMTDILDTMLPGVLQEHNMTLHFTPKFSDFRDNEYVRYPLELRYGASKRWELLGGITPFGPNPFNSGHDHRWGPGQLKLGARYDLGRSLSFFDDTTLGLETRIPLGKPPVELNDHYTHVKPFVSAARRLNDWPDVTLYTNVSYDRSVELTHRGPPPPEVMRTNTIEAVPGLLFKPSELGYFAEYRYRHIAEENEWHVAHEVRFGAIWDVPIATTDAWRLPGKWTLELAYKISQEEGRGTNHGIAARVNWRTSLREVLTYNSGKTALSR